MSRKVPPPNVARNRVSQSAASGDYLSVDAPGDSLQVGQAVPSDATDMHHLAILVAQVQEIDWLELRRAGHHRAVFSANTWEWRVP